MKATNIKWDVSEEEILTALDSLTAQEASKRLEIPYSTYANMTTSERHEYALDAFHHNLEQRAEFIGLPDEVMLPEEAINWEDDEITDYLSDEYGYFINGYDLPERDGFEKD